MSYETTSRRSLTDRAKDSLQRGLERFIIAQEERVQMTGGRATEVWGNMVAERGREMQIAAGEVREIREQEIALRHDTERPRTLSEIVGLTGRAREAVRERIRVTRDGLRDCSAQAEACGRSLGPVDRVRLLRHLW